MNTANEQFKSLRTACGLSQSQCAKYLGLTVRTVGHLDNDTVVKKAYIEALKLYLLNKDLMGCLND